MTVEQAALDHYRSRRALANGAAVAGSRLWSQVDANRIVASWRLLVPQMLVVLTGAQLAAARAAPGYVGGVLAEQGIDPLAAGRLVAEAFAGVASDGRNLGDLLASPAFTAVQALRGGASVGSGLASGSAALDMMLRTQVADAGRTADQVALVATPQASGYVRLAVGVSCSRCAILAGRRYRWSSGFSRHPRCDCVHVPAAGASADQVRADPRAYFDSLSREQQDRLFTKAGAEAIRSGADINQVVNARRGMFTAGSRRLTTTSTTARGVSPGVRLMPEQILAEAADRADALRLLDRFGYLRADLRPIQVPAVPVAIGTDALAAARAGLDRLRPGGVRLTTVQRSALRDYESATGLGINAALRSGDGLSTFVAGRVAQIDGVMAAAPLTADVSVWRGVADVGRVFGPAAEGRLTGAVWTERGYLSTTADERIARQFAEPGGDVRAVMRLRVPSGTGAVRISGAGIGGQAELLLQRNLRLRVVADTGPGSVPRRIDVEIVS